MGKKASGKWSAAGEDTDAPKTRPVHWTKTSSMMISLCTLEREGLLRPKDEKVWRVPGTESTLAPENDERVAFVDHVHRGLSFRSTPSLQLFCVRMGFSCTTSTQTRYNT